MVVDFPTLLLGFEFTSPGPVVPGLEVGPFVIRWYGLLIASAVLIGVRETEIFLISIQHDCAKQQQ